VLVPNTRGRGGYGDALEQGISDGKSMVGRPFEDAMAGIDLLIERGIADAGRLGILGHSYGGSFTVYAVTQTNRFKGAVAHEAGAADMIGHYAYPFEPGSWRRLLARDLGGIHDPTDPAEGAVMLAEAPGLHANRVKTPTLMQFGAKALAESAGRPLFNAWRHFGVPTALFVYDEGHVFDRPAAIADDLTRTIEWLDHWVRGIEYPDAGRAKEYEAWRKSGSSAQAPAVREPVE
jgi:dipeptidyl aminopeptidase/acylaminoacyl peptidase